MFSTGISILEAVVGFSFLIFVHELGHFLAAKWIGVRVDIFSLGFGPALKKKWGDTEYRLSAVPLGGFVKMAGEEPTPEKPAQPGDFYTKTVGQRAIVFVAGVTMNLIFGFLAFMAAYKVGVPVVPAKVGDVEPASSAWRIGLQRGDVIQAIDGVSPPVDFEDLKTQMTLARPGEAIRLTVLRDGKKFERTIHPEYSKALGLLNAGIYPPDTMTVAKVKVRGRKAGEEGDIQRVFDAGMKPGDVVTAVQVAGQEQPTPVATLNEYLDAIANNNGQPVRIDFLRNGRTQSVTLDPELVGKPHLLGVRFGSNGVLAVRPESWAEQAGLKPDDVIVSVEGKRVRSRREVVAALQASSNEPVVVSVQRGGSPVEIRVPARPAGEKVDAVLAFRPDLVADGIMKGYPADKIGMEPGDEIISARVADSKEAAEEVHDVPALAKVLQSARGNPVEVTWKRDGKAMSATFTPQKEWTVLVPFQTDQSIMKAGVSDSIRLGARKATQWIKRVYATLRSLVTGSVAVRHVSGPLSIAYFTYAAATQGPGLLLYLLGILSVNLAVVNILPIPVLDGGHLLFAAMEKVRGKPVDEKIRNGATYVGLALIIGLMVLAFWNDIYGFFIKPFME